MKVFITILLIFSLPLLAQVNNQQVLNNYNSSKGNYFIENKGQWPEEVLYLTKIGGMNAWITKTGVVYDYYKIERNYNKEEAIKLPPLEKDEFERKNTSIKGHVVRMNLVNSKPNPEAIANNKQETYYNYFLGNDERKWASNVGLYEEIELDEVYDGIGIRYYFDEGLLRYDYHVKPNADLSQLQFELKGEDNYSVNDKGELVIQTSLGEVTHGKLFAYQESKNVECYFTFDDASKLTIKAPSYDKNKLLIIDPIVSGAYLGGSYEDIVNASKSDNIGNLYLAGYTSSSDFPSTIGAYQNSFGLGYEFGFITNIKSDLSEIIYSTFIGGESYETIMDLALDKSNNIYVVGQTFSNEFPTTINLGNNYFGGSNGFIVKISSDGSNLLFSSLIGGGSFDITQAITLDEDEDIYISGYTQSSDFYTTPGVLANTIGSASDGYICKINSTGTQFLYSTFIGGQGIEAKDIAIDKYGNAHIIGFTSSSDYFTTSYILHPFASGGIEGLLIIVNSDASNIIFSSLVGGNDQDFCESIEIDNADNIYITGSTKSKNFPRINSSIQLGYNNGDSDAFLMKVAPLGSELIYSLLIRGHNDDYGSDIEVNNKGSVYLVGSTNSYDFPLTPNGFQQNIMGARDGFLTVINDSASEITFSTLLGGSNNDYIRNIELVDAKNLFISGFTNSTNIVTSTPSLNNYYSGGDSDIFTFRLEIPEPEIRFLAPMGNEILKSNSINDIAWTGEFKEGQLIVELTTNGGNNWFKLGETNSNTYTFQWQVLPINTSNAAIRIYYAEHPEEKITSNNFSITTGPTDELSLYDNLINQIIPGDSLEIKWDYSGDIKYVNLQYSPDYGYSWIDIVTSYEVAKKTYSWIIPYIFSPKVQLRIVDSEDDLVYDYSKNILFVSNLLLAFPQEFKLFKGGQEVQISWNYEYIDQLRIDLSIDNGLNWQPITVISASFNSYNWIVPNINSKLCLIKISSNANPNLYDISKDNFEIWSIKKDTLSTTIGNNNLTSSTTEVELDLFAIAPNNIFIEFNPREKPLFSNLPYGIFETTDFYWKINSDNLTFIDGKIKIDTSLISAAYPFDKLTWLKRESWSSAWEEIGGNIEDQSFVSTTSFSSFSEFTLGKIEGRPQKPIQLFPANNSIKHTIPLEVKWEKVDGAQSYDLQLGKKTVFLETIQDIQDTSIILSDLDYDSKYYWRVRSKNIYGTTGWSSLWNFSTLSLPHSIVLVLPENNSINNNTDITFKWSLPQESKIENSFRSNLIYLFELSIDTTAFPVLIDSGLTQNSKNISNLNYSKTYFWRVKAQNELGWGEYTQWNKFTTIIEKPAVVTLVNPTNESLGNIKPVTIKWEQSNRAATYNLQLSTDNSFATSLVDTTLLTDTSFVLNHLADLTTYYWRVKAINVGGESDWSTPWSFRTLGEPLTVNLLQPAANSIKQPVNITFIWHKGAEKFRLPSNDGIVIKGKGKNNSIQTISNYWFELSKDINGSPLISDSTLSDTTYIVNELDYLTDYFWRVKSKNEVSWSEFSEWSKFTTIIQKPEIVDILSPTNNSENLISPITFSWNHSERSESYNFQIASSNEFTNMIVDSSAIADTSLSINSLAPFNTYYWKVKAINVGGESDWSDIWSFTVLGVPNSPVLISPEDNTVLPDTASAVAFKWTSSIGADSYNLNISISDSFDSLYAEIKDLSDTVYNHNSTLIPSVFYWRVKAINQAGESDWSNTNSITIVSSVDPRVMEIPTQYELSQNYPNPFNPSTIIKYGLPEESNVKVSIYSILGEEIAELVNTQQSAGYYNVTWNAQNLSSGIYLVRISANSIDGKSNFTDVKKMLLIK